MSFKGEIALYRLQDNTLLRKKLCCFFADENTAPFLDDILPSSGQTYALSRVKLRPYQGKM